MLAEKIAVACRILASEGVVQGSLGHVSARVPGTETMLVRCRGPVDAGVLFTTAEDIHQVDLDGGGDLPDGYAPPGELPLHSAVYRLRLDVGCVVHAHPTAVLACDLAGVDIRPVLGAFNIPAFRLASEGIAKYPRSCLIRSPERGREVAEALGSRTACILSGHGVVVAGATVEETTVRTLDLEALARVCLSVAQAGGHPADVSPEDAAELPDLGSAFNDELAFRHYARVEETRRPDVEPAAR